MPADIPRSATATGRATKPVNQSALLRSLGYNCLQAYLTVVPSIKKELEAFGLRPVEFTILSLVNANPGLNQKRLGQTIKVSPPNLATVLDRMEANGLLKRQRNPLDKRSQILVLTDEGRTRCAQAEEIAEHAESTPKLSPAERQQLLLLLQKVFL